jgi:hypothetical protein
MGDVMVTNPVLSVGTVTSEGATVAATAGF